MIKENNLLFKERYRIEFIIPLDAAVLLWFLRDFKKETNTKESIEKYMIHTYIHTNKHLLPQTEEIINKW